MGRGGVMVAGVKRTFLSSVPLNNKIKRFHGSNEGQVICAVAGANCQNKYYLIEIVYFRFFKGNETQFLVPL